jgi:hypothetical protein
VKRATASALLAVAVGAGACRWLPGSWGADEAAARHRPLFDDDQDGVVSRAEYVGRRYAGPPFSAVDLDRDGDLDAAELLRLARGQDGQRFDGAQAPRTLPPPPAVGVLGPDALLVLEVLGWMHSALTAAGAAPPLDPEQLQRAALTGALDSAESRQLLDQLRGPWAAQGWTWPVGVP